MIQGQKLRHVTTPQGEIKWTYDATGRKLKKEVTAVNGVSISYQEGIEIYSDGSTFVNHAEGRMAYYPVDESGQPAPHWQSELAIKDHPEFSGQVLGNNRLFLCDKNGNGRIELKGEDANDPEYTEIIQESHYYPFGLEMQGPWNPTQWEPSNAYRYNGKELNTDLGLDWYDYGARWYDAGIARWGAVDPLAEQYLNWSAYNYVMGNPVRLVDPDGMATATYDPQLLADEKREASQERLKRLMGRGGDDDNGGPDDPPEKVAATITLPGAVVTASRPQTLKQDWIKVGDRWYPTQVIFALAKTDKNSSLFKRLLRGSYGEELAYDFNLFIIRSAQNAAGEVILNIQITILTSAVPFPAAWVNRVGRLFRLGRAAPVGSEGGLNLFKWGASQTTKSTGWKVGDYMLHLPNKGTPKLNWKANYGALRREMKFGNPIFDSYRLPNGNLIPTGGFLNAERSILLGRGWMYNPNVGAWLPPGF